MRTAEIRRIRTEYLMGSLTADDAEVFENILLDSILFQTDVRIIGWHFETELQLSGVLYTDLGSTRTACFVARGAPTDLNNRWAVLHNSVNVWRATGATAPSSQQFTLHRVEDVMFPDGHGFDVDEGESVYLYGTNRNVNMGGVTHLNGTCVLYYVKR